VHTIIEMVNCTRLDCAVGVAGLMRAAVVQAVHHARHRTAFGKRLIEQPLMQNVLADLIVESEAATLLALRVASSFDLKHSSEEERRFARVATAISKYWLAKRVISHVGEALECLGGNGYVEESIMPRLYREAPLYSIWEGSGNVICLDVLRAFAKDPGTLDALVREIWLGARGVPRFEDFVEAVEGSLRKHARQITEGRGSESEKEARRLTENAAVALQASLLLRYGPPAVAEAFFATRIGGDGGHTYGTLPAEPGFEQIVARVSANLPM
jgi:putative acyl-CoA dehydrogenase